jgi:hypothetical protein
MKKINTKSKGYTLGFDLTKDKDTTKVVITIPTRDRNDRMTYWTCQELIDLINNNVNINGKVQNYSSDLIYALDDSENKITLNFKEETKIKTNVLNKAKTYQKRSKK